MHPCSVATPSQGKECLRSRMGAVKYAMVPPPPKNWANKSCGLPNPKCDCGCCGLSYLWSNESTPTTGRGTIGMLHWARRSSSPSTSYAAATCVLCKLNATIYIDRVGLRAHLPKALLRIRIARILVGVHLHRKPKMAWTTVYLNTTNYLSTQLASPLHLRYAFLTSCVVACLSRLSTA